MVYVQAGQFPMGSNDGDPDEQPVHTVVLDAFWIDRTEVTNEQYITCMAAGVCEAPRCAGYDDAAAASYPVTCVDWSDAAAYCAWVGARLPTEAEWEYAARGPQGYTYPWGNDAPTCDRANYSGCVGGRDRIGSRPSGASWCGALDMAGNVWEWVVDWHDSGYYASSPSSDPQGPASGVHRVLRGGSWYVVPLYARSADRSRFGPGHTDGNLGFRCARGS